MYAKVDHDVSIRTTIKPGFLTFYYWSLPSLTAYTA